MVFYVYTYLDFLRIPSILSYLSMIFSLWRCYDIYMILYNLSEAIVIDFSGICKYINLNDRNGECSSYSRPRDYDLIISADINHSNWDNHQWPMQCNDQCGHQQSNGLSSSLRWQGCGAGNGSLRTRAHYTMPGTLLPILCNSKWKSLILMRKWICRSSRNCVFNMHLFGSVANLCRNSVN